MEGGCILLNRMREPKMTMRTKVMPARPQHPSMIADALFSAHLFSISISILYISFLSVLMERARGCDANKKARSKC